MTFIQTLCMTIGAIVLLVLIMGALLFAVVYLAVCGFTAYEKAEKRRLYSEVMGQEDD